MFGKMDGEDRKVISMCLSFEPPDLPLRGDGRSLGLDSVSRNDIPRWTRERISIGRGHTWYGKSPLKAQVRTACNGRYWKIGVMIHDVLSCVDQLRVIFPSPS